jgi:hypothetical protein
MKNITTQIKEAISVNALWSISDFFYFLEILNDNGFETSYWKGEENWAGLIHNDVLIGYIWHKYPLIFIKEDRADEIELFIKELEYIIVIKSKDLVSEEFSIDVDEDLFNRINYFRNTKNFSANDLWFYTNT